LGSKKSYGKATKITESETAADINRARLLAVLTDQIMEKHLNEQVAGINLLPLKGRMITMAINLIYTHAKQGIIPLSLYSITQVSYPHRDRLKVIGNYVHLTLFIKTGW
jgi:hypothetical protein